MGELTKEIWIDAPPDKVYRFLVEPDLTVRWFGEEAWNDPQAGGLYHVNVRGNIARGEFVELDGGTRVRLRHTGLSDRGVERHSEGWDYFVPELARAAAA